MHRKLFPVAIVVAWLLSTGVGIASAEQAVRTFDAEPVESAPADTVSRGAVTVAATPFGPAGNRAVRLVDSSTVTDSSVLFPAAAAPIRAWSMDLAPHWIQPFVIAVHGVTADGAPAEVYRLTIATVYNWGKHSSGQVSITRGSTTMRWAVIPELTDQDRPTTVTLTASPDALVLRVGEFVFRSTDRVADAVAMTGIELRSPGFSATGTEVYLDNVVVTEPLTEGELAVGVVASGRLTSITAATKPQTTLVATVDQPGVAATNLQAIVHAGDQWVTAQIYGAPGHLRVLAPLLEPNIGLHPITLTITDRSTGLQRSTQMRTQSYAPISVSTVVQEAAGLKEARFVDATRLRDGRIVAVYHYADAHTQANGVIRLVSSSDEGKTWSAPVTVVTNQYDNRDPKIMQLRDGTILLSMFRTDWSASGVNVGTFVLRSTDGGLSFPEETRIPGMRTGTYEHAPAVELANGDVLQPLYGSGARVARSTDGGRTFPAANEIMVAADTSTYYHREPNLVALPSGELVMLIRMNFVSVGAERQSTIVRSFDNGHSWTAPEWTDLPTSSHHMLLTNKGNVLLTFGNILQPDRPTYASLITDPSGPWTGYRQVPVYNSGAGDDQANPSSVQLADGSFLSFGTNPGTRSVVSWLTQKSTYR